MDTAWVGIVGLAVAGVFVLEHQLRKLRPEGLRPSKFLASLASCGQRFFRFLGVCFAYLTNATYFFWRWLVPGWRALLARMKQWLKSVVEATWQVLLAFDRLVQRLWRNLLRAIVDLAEYLRALVLRILGWIPWQEIRQSTADLVVPVWDLMTSPIFFVVGYLDITARIRVWWRPLLFPTLALCCVCLAWIGGFSWNDLDRVVAFLSVTNVIWCLWYAILLIVLLILVAMLCFAGHLLYTTQTHSPRIRVEINRCTSSINWDERGLVNSWVASTR